MWKEMAAQGWLGIHLPEEFGGQGFGLFELAVLLEETGWSLVPGPLLPTVAASAVVAEASNRRRRPTGPARADRREHAGRPVFGPRPASRRWVRDREGELVVSGTLRPLLGAATASVVLAPARRPDGSVIWCLLDVAGSAGRVRATPLASLDPTRRVGVVEVDEVGVRAEHQLRRL